MAQNLQKMFCPSCGAPLQFIDGREYTFCQYCGYQIFKEDTQLGIKLNHEQVKMKYADRHEAREYEYSDRDKQRSFLENDRKLSRKEKREERRLRKYEEKQKTKRKIWDNSEIIGLIVLLIFILILYLSL